jgi:redox-sensitive bicupin YhaK (pirin superfamily)
MADSSIENVLAPRVRDLGEGFRVQRVLPASQRRAVGPFVFFDQMGPTVLKPGAGLDVRPHPHIGLATVTYLLDGEILHRDSLGTVQPIRPGAVNWMTAGRGIAHSERTPPELRATGSRLFGVQVWVGLPRACEEAEPAFAHHPAASLPMLEDAGVRLRVIVGSLLGREAPVAVFSQMFFADAALDANAGFGLPPRYEERAIYVIEGRVLVEAAVFEAGQLILLRPDRRVAVKAERASRVLMFGGEPLDGPRHLWWNFVSSSRERIEQAKEDWRGGRFVPVPGDTEFIPLPQ